MSGETYAKIRAMYDDKGEPITEAPPATPVQILGFSDVPVAGETFRVVADDRTARAPGDLSDSWPRRLPQAPRPSARWKASLPRPRPARSRN